ncbi:Uncharacterised protein [Mycobacterium tuberculosis]|nr:Uncharacterised protein [Mycobacterium tuberculosis]
MAELDPGADDQRPCLLGGVEVGRAQPQCRAGPPQQPGVAGRVGRGEQQQEARRRGQRLQLRYQAPLDTALQRHRPGEGEPAGAERPGQLAQRERVAARLGDQPVADPPVEDAGRREAQQLAGVGVAQPLDGQPAQPSERLADRAHDEHDGDPLGVEAPGGERDGARRRLVEPLRVVDDAEQRTVLRGLGEQAQHREPDEQRAGRGGLAQAECRLDRLALRCGQPLGGAHHRAAQLLQSGVGELHLRLGRDDALDPDAGRGIRDRPVQERGLADPGLAADDERAAEARAGALHQRVQFRQLAMPSPQRHGFRHDVTFAGMQIRRVSYPPNPSQGGYRRNSALPGTGRGGPGPLGS